MPSRSLPSLVAALPLVASLVASLVGCARPAPRHVAPSASAPPPSAPTPATPVAPQPPKPAGYAGLGVESVPPELLARHAARPLAPEQSRRIQAMLDVRSPGAGMITTDGQQLYFGWTVTGVPQIFRLDGPKSFPVQLTGGEDATTLVGMSPRGEWLFVQRDRSGEENPGLYLLWPEGGPLIPVQHLPKVQTVFDLVESDGRAIYFHANDQTPESYAIYRFDLATRKRELVFGEPGIWSAVDIRNEKEGTVLLLEKAVGSNMSEFYEYEVATKKLTPVIGQGEREDHVVRYGQRGEFLVLTPKLGEFRRLYVYKDKRLEPLTPELKHDVSGFSIDRGRVRILYTVNEGGYTRPHVLDAVSKRPLRLPALPDADHITFVNTTLDGMRTTAWIDTGTAPPQSVVIDWSKRRTAAWHRPAAPEIDTSTFAKVALENYPARDGTPIPMFVRRPAACAKRTEAEGPCPVIVSFHGGPEGQSVAGFNTRAQLFVDAGFVYVEPNVRGSDGYGRSWLHADDGAKRLAVLTDIEDASIHVRKAWKLGGKAPKVGVYGGSYGGYATLAAMTIFAGSYDAGVSVVGISSLTTFLMNTAPYRRALRVTEYGDPEKDREALERLSPIRFIDKLAAPLLLIQGATDPRVPVGEATQFYEAMQKKGLPGELILFPDEGHGMRKRGNQVLALGHTLRFFQTHLAR